MGTTPRLTSERLQLIPLQAERLEALHPIFAAAEAMAHMPTPPHASPAETAALLRQESSRSGAHYWIITRHGSTDPLGMVNFLGETRVPGLGYIIRRDCWGQGFATEACRTALDFGFGALGLERVELWIEEGNIASQRVAAKLGFQIKGRLPLKYPHRPHNHIMLVFGQRAAAWRGAPEQQREVPFYRSEAVLEVRDVAAAAAFYRDRLGFQIDFLYGDPPEHGGVSRGGWSGSGVVLQLSQAPPGKALRPAGYLYIFVGSEIDRLYAQYRDAGVTIVSPPESQPWGLREFSVRDLDDQLLCFGTHV